MLNYLETFNINKQLSKIPKFYKFDNKSRLTYEIQ